MHCLVISANAFLWHQIRCIMAVLLMIGKKLEDSSVITQLLDTENNPRYRICYIVLLGEKKCIGVLLRFVGL